MIQLSGAGKRFGQKLLFENLNWLITSKDRSGLVGANGTGKTTLLKILASIESLDYGGLSVTRGISAGYLPQDGLSLSGRSVFAECMSVFSSLREMEQEMEDLTHRMPELDPAGVEYSQVAERFHQLDSEFRNRDGYAIEAQVGTVLAGLGFPHAEWNRRASNMRRWRSGSINWTANSAIATDMRLRLKWARYWPGLGSRMPSGTGGRRICAGGGAVPSTGQRIPQSRRICD